MCIRDSSWDRYTDARRPRLATDREVRTLRSLLEVSLVDEDAPTGSLAAHAQRIRAEREQQRPLEVEAPAVSEPIAPPETSAMRIRIRRLIRRERKQRRPARVG